MRMLSRSRVPLLALSLMLACTARWQEFAAAQESSPPAESVVVVPEPIGVPVSQITAEAEDARESIAELRTIAQPDPDIEKIAEDFSEEESATRGELEKTARRLGEGLSFRDLEDLAKRWDRELDRLRKRQETTSKRAASLDEALERLQGIRSRWEATDTQGQEALQNIVVEILGLTQEAENQLGTARTHLTEIRAPLRELRAEVEGIQDEIEAARAKRNVQLAKAESPQLWNHPAWSTGLMDLKSYLAQSWRYMRLDLEEFFVDNAERLLQHLVAVLILIAILFVIRRRLESSEVDEDRVRRHSRVLQNPIATTLLITIAFLGEVYPKAPPVVMDLGLVVVFFPYLRVLPEGILSRARLFLFSIWFLFVLGRVEMFFPTDSLILRLLLLLQSLVGVMVFGAAMRRSASGDPLLTRRTMSLANAMVRLSGLALAIAIVANLFGYGGLTRFLNGIGINGAYASILLFGLYQVLRGLIEVVPELPLLQKSRMIQRHRALIQRRLTTLNRWLMVIWGVDVYLRLANVKDALIGGIESILTAEARFGELGISLGGVLAFFLTIYAASLLSRFIRFLLEEDVYYRVYLPRGVPNAISTSLHYVIMLLGFTLAIAATGVELSKLTILVGAFGVGIGFGLQDIVRNYVSGAVLLLERPVMPGDTVQTPQLWGQVKRIGIRSSTVRTWEGAEVIVPNSDLVMNQVTNWTLSDRQRRLEIAVGVAYGSDPAAVVELLVDVAKANDEILESPTPYCLFLGFGESSLDFSLRAWTVKFDDFLRIRSELTMAVHTALAEAGFEIPFPQRDLHLRSSEVELGVSDSREAPGTSDSR